MKLLRIISFLEVFHLASVLVLLHSPARSDQVNRVISRGGPTRELDFVNFKEEKYSYLNITALVKHLVDESYSCAFACLESLLCFSFNLAASHNISNGKFWCDLLPSDKYNNSDKLVRSNAFHHFSIPTPCSSWPCKNNGTCATLYAENNYLCVCKEGFTGKHCENGISCAGLLKRNRKATDGKYTISAGSSAFQTYCDMTTSGQAWTLIARFSNNDSKNWMHDSGEWWYDKNIEFGETADPSSNTDMISQAFWLVSGQEFKITRSDDPKHTALLRTTGDCLGGRTFRAKMTSYGDFRHGTVWASDRCLGNCNIQYGGQHNTTDGFKQAACNGKIQNATQIGFWCDWSGGDGAVLMIGGGGSTCERADHGVGITEANQASFVEQSISEPNHDFGNEAGGSSGKAKSYSLNLWIH